MGIRKKNIITLLILAVFGFFVAFPLLFPNPAVTSIAVFALIFAVAAMGYNLFSGYTGYLSLGHAAFYGIGAYLLALLCQLWKVPGGILPFLLLPVVGVLTGVCALLPGWIALKTRRFTFLVMTLAIFALAAQLPNFLTGLIPGIGELTLPIPTWSGDTYNTPFYYVALLLLLVVCGISWWIRHSRYGLALLAIRDDEDRAEGLGIRVVPLKLSAFLLSASFVGMAGAMTVYFIGFIASPSAFDRSLNIAFPLMIFLGGAGTIWGPLLGAIIITALQQYLTLQFGTQDLALILYGALLLVITLTLPRGIIPTLSRRWKSYTSASSPSTSEESWSIANREEVLAAPSISLPSTPVSGMVHLAFQEGRANERPLASSAVPLSPFIPHRPVGFPTMQEVPSTVKAYRLVSLATTPTEKPGDLPGPMTPLPPGKWLCPRCQEPLLNPGESYFCPQCGLKLPGVVSRASVS